MSEEKIVDIQVSLDKDEMKKFEDDLKEREERRWFIYLGVFLIIPRRKRRDEKKRQEEEERRQEEERKRKYFAYCWGSVNFLDVKKNVLEKEKKEKNNAN